MFDRYCIIKYPRHVQIWLLQCFVWPIHCPILSYNLCVRIINWFLLRLWNDSFYIDCKREDAFPHLIQPARAESARAVTGRRCPHSGTGQDFLARNGPNRTKTGVTRQRSERFGRAQRLNGANAEGYKRPVDKNRGPISKNGFSGRNPKFLAQKKKPTFQS